MTGFRSSASLPAGPSPRCEAKEKVAASYHVRSISLPYSSHSLISQIEDEISSIRSWQSEIASNSYSSTFLEVGMGRLELLHGVLEEFLQLPQTQQSLHSCRFSSWAERLLDDFLCLANTYGRFRDGALVSVQQIQSNAQAVIWRRDNSKLRSHCKAMRKAEKDIAKLGSSLRELTNSASRPLEVVGAADVELVGILREAKLVMDSTSTVVFSGFAAILASSFSHGCSSWTSVLKKKLASSKDMSHGELELKLMGLKELEKSITSLENGSERVFKCLIKTRVSLLNTLTPKFITQKESRYQF